MQTRMMVLTLVAGLICGAVCAADTAAPPQQQIVLTIMTPQINSFAPGIDAAVGLTPEQANQLATAYREVFNSSAVVLSNLVLQDATSTPAQRQAAQATLQQAQNLFAVKGRAVLTPQQTKLVDTTQAAFTRILNAAQTQMVEAVKTNFGKELETLLTAEQKAAMMKARAEIEAANKKAQEQKPPTAPAAGGK
ncbi:MAG: hypothetical protein ABFE07_27595 [Armatimonadia bacterium]